MLVVGAKAVGLSADTVNAFVARVQALDLEQTGLDYDLILAGCLFWCVFWPVLINVLKFLLYLFASSMPDNLARIPTTLPLDDPPGVTPPLPQPLVSASNAQKKAFRKYMKDNASDFPLADAEGDSDGVLAARFKAQLYDIKAAVWATDHFEHRKPGLKYPQPAPTWNGWSGFWLELSTNRQGEFTGCLALGFEHFVCGLLLPLNYMYGEQFGMPFGGSLINFTLASYGDIGANIVDSILTASG